MFSLRLVPHLDATRSLHFDPIERKLSPSSSLKLGRFTDRGTPQSASDTRIAFKSKVVSRGHADIFTDPAGAFFIRDTKSSSGTFLNHIRLSPPGTDSRPFPLRDGDVLQLGVDYQGGTEEIYRCVKMRVELNRGWQRSANAFNQQALAQLRTLGARGTSPAAAPAAAPPTAEQPKAVSDCCICLFGVTVCQALFIAPCSHTYHYKCIRPLLQMHHPGFSCPLCRTFADLEADVETEEQPLPAPPSAPELVRASATFALPAPAPDTAQTTRASHNPATARDDALERLARISAEEEDDPGAADRTATALPTLPSVGLDRAHTMVMTSEMAAAYRANMGAPAMGLLEETQEEDDEEERAVAAFAVAATAAAGADADAGAADGHAREEIEGQQASSSLASSERRHTRRSSDNPSVLSGDDSSVASDDLLSHARRTPSSAVSTTAIGTRHRIHKQRLHNPPNPAPDILAIGQPTANVDRDKQAPMPNNLNQSANEDFLAGPVDQPSHLGSSLS